MPRDVYVGPFLECKKKRVLRQVEVVGCPSSKKKRKAHYCGSCGGLVGTFMITKEIWSSPHGVANRVMGRLILVEIGENHGDPDRFVPDCMDSDSRVLYFQGLMAAVEIDREADLAWFLEEYRNDIQKINEEYGQKNVRVVYGVCTW